MSLKQSGATLIELMVGMLTGLLLLTGIIHLYMGVVRSNSGLMMMTRLEYEMRTAMALMSDDIRRAGFYSGSASNLFSGTVANPFMVAGVDLSIPTSSCILFAYDRDANGTLPALNSANSDERFGYRLVNSVLEARPTTLDSFACDEGAWDSLNNSDLVEMTNLQFALSSTVETSGASNVVVRTVTITLSGRLKKDTSVTRTLVEEVRIRNDKVNL